MVKIHLDGASLEDMERFAARVDGFTTNPSLMRAAGVTDYKAFAKEVLAIAGGKPVSFEVLADEFSEIVRQGREIASWGDNVLVKVPVVNRHGQSHFQEILRLSADGVPVNVTAVLTEDQAFDAMQALDGRYGIVSVFAGRIADTSRDPAQVVRCADLGRKSPRSKVLWASAREVLNVTQATVAGADIITLSPALLDKYESLFRKDLQLYSSETVAQFVKDAAGITLH